VTIWAKHAFINAVFLIQNKGILNRALPDVLKLAIAQKIENNLFAKVCFAFGLLHQNKINQIESRCYL
jgi:hypothetical protein